MQPQETEARYAMVKAGVNIVTAPLAHAFGQKVCANTIVAVAAVTEPGVTRARLRAMLTSCGRDRLSVRIPPADKRTAARALDVEYEN